MEPIIKDINTRLLQSDANQRLIWAKEIVSKNIGIDYLYAILEKDNKTSMRGLWLIGDLADHSPAYLKPQLHSLYEICMKLKEIEINASFAKFWFLCGVPEEDEVEALNLLFKWLNSPKTNVTTKSRALFALNKMTDKYSDIIPEFISIVENQLDRNSIDFRKRATKVLKQLRNS